MNRFSLIKCTIAFGLIAVYIWLFSIVGTVGTPEDVPLVKYADDSDEFNPSLQELLGDKTETSLAPDNPLLTSYDTTIDPRNLDKPGAADLPAVAVTAFYDEASLTELSVQEASAQAAEVTEVVTKPAITTSATPAATTTTPAPGTPKRTAGTTEIIPEADDNSLEELPETQPEITSATPYTTVDTPPPAANSPQTADPSAAKETLTVMVNGSAFSGTALDIVSRTVQNEIGSAYEIEAIKAQAVATYTYIKMHQINGATAAVNMANVASERVAEAVKSVLGQAIYYNNEMISAVYSASSAGYTASAKNVWGSELPYLQSVACDLDARFDPNYGLTLVLTSQEVMTQVLLKTGIELTGDPGAWFRINSYVDTVYVGQMTVGGQTSYTKNGETVEITGRTFRERVMSGQKFRSAAFDITYDSVKDIFTFKTYGYGHGAGMSQNGANLLARYNGYNYLQILEFYYKGVVIK
ncbi:hypothetical protein FACS189499_07010 [Clostridia bacterium]|nr:hypothetical protein FACS189499_07010 [Clostridia bacterium]